MPPPVSLRSSTACPPIAAQSAILQLADRLNADDRVDGILVQLPLPSGLDIRAAIAAVDPAKDVDGFHPVNVGRLWNGEPGLVACTPLGVLLLLRSTGRDLVGAEAVVLGRSAIVGRPAAALLLAADCTVTIVHSKTRECAAATCRRADILVIAGMGRPAAVTADWIKPGAIVIDVGISRVARPEGGSRLVGDVDFAAVRRIAGRDHPGAGRGRADDDSLPAAQHTCWPPAGDAACRTPPAAAGLTTEHCALAGTARSRGLFYHLTILERESPVMTNKSVMSLAFAAGCVLALGAMPSAQAQNYMQPTPMQSDTVTNGPQASRGDFGDWSARRNVIESGTTTACCRPAWAFVRRACARNAARSAIRRCATSAWRASSNEPNMVGDGVDPAEPWHEGGNAGQ